MFETVFSITVCFIIQYIVNTTCECLNSLIYIVLKVGTHPAAWEYQHFFSTSSTAFDNIVTSCPKCKKANT